MNLEHGERFHQLKVLRKTPSGRYRCGCSCGRSDTLVRAAALMSGRVKACRKCAVLSCKEDSSNKERT